MLHELWEDEGDYTFCLAGPTGDQARSILDPKAKLIWTVYADDKFEAMTKYYKFMDWELYRSDFSEDKDSYPVSWIETQK